MIVCKVCGATNEQGATFCGTCGSFLEWSGEPVAPDGTTAGQATSAGPPPGPQGPAGGDQPTVVDPVPVPLPVPTTPDAIPAGYVVCPNCGQANEPTRVYCSRCATELAAVTAAPVPIPEPTPARSIPPVAIAGIVGAVILLGVLAFVFLGPKSAQPSSGAVITSPSPPASAGASSGPSGGVASPPASTEPSGGPASAPPPVVSGKLVFAAVKDGNADIYEWAAGDAQPHKLFGGAGDESDPMWSPDGSKVVFSENVGAFKPLGGTPNEGLRVIKSDGTKAKVFDLTHHDVDRNPAWAPDGKSIVWASTRDHANNKNLDIHSRVDEVTTDETLLVDDPADDWDPAYSPDGKTIIFVTKRDGPATLYTMTPEGRKQQPLDLGTGVYDDPTYSRVGDLLAYTMKASDGAQKQLFVAGQDGSDGRQVGAFTGDISDPTWSPDARLIAVANDDTGGIDIVDVATGEVLDSLSVPNATLMQPDWAQ